MLESLEGKRGEVRPRPPLPAIKGLFGQPTIVNNVISLASVPIILEGRRVLPRLRRRPLARHAAAPARRQHQARRARREGLRRDAARAAVRLRRRRALGPPDPRGAGRRAARRLRAGVAVRHAARLRGVRRHRRDARPRRHRRVRRHRRHGADGALRDGVLRDRVVRQVHAVPHRLDARRRGDRRRACGQKPATTTCALLEELCETMMHGSLCGLGGLTPFPVQSALKHFREDFGSARPARAGRPPEGDARETSYVLHGLPRPRHAGSRFRDASWSRSRSTAGPVTVPDGTSIMRAAACRDARSRSSAPPTR